MLHGASWMAASPGTMDVEIAKPGLTAPGRECEFGHTERDIRGRTDLNDRKGI